MVPFRSTEIAEILSSLEPRAGTEEWRGRIFAADPSVRTSSVEGREMKPRFCNHLQNGAVVASLNMPTLSKLK
jgi:hypothetical protein